jgi:formate hydrogenlyase transcriptional activator
VDPNLTTRLAKLPAAARSDEPQGRAKWGGAPAGSPCLWEERAPPAAGGLEERRLRLKVEKLEKELREAREEMRRLRCQLGRETVEAGKQLKRSGGHTGIIGRSSALRHTLAQARQVAVTGSTVLLLGETGTGKELFASAIHELSSRARRAMVRVNCAAIPATLLESEFFGREKGAYTGAFARQIGSFELANGSTLFLDEVGELPLEMQAKLLRVLQEMKIQRLGSPASIKVDVRVIAASNRDLARLAREGKFRQDLYYRLNVFPIQVPPLRERQQDIPLLVSAFVNEFAQAMGKVVQPLERSNLQALEAYGWPGNVRELRNAVERALILAHGPTMRIELPGAGLAAPRS